PSSAYVLGLPDAACGSLNRRQTRDLPVPVRGASVHAWGLRPRGVPGRLALTAPPVWPSASIHRVGTPEYPPLARRGKRFRGSIPSLHVPLPTLRPRPCRRARMTRGQSGSLLLSLCGSFIHDTSPVCTGARIGSNDAGDQRPAKPVRCIARLSGPLSDPFLHVGEDLADAGERLLQKAKRGRVLSLEPKIDPDDPFDGLRRMRN